MGLVDCLKSSFLGAALAGCAVAPSDYPIEKFSPLYFANSPYMEVTGAHYPSDYKKTLIHLRQMHFSKDGNLEKYNWINSSQREIYHFLRDMKKDGVKELFVEGFDDSSFIPLSPSDNYSYIMSYLIRSGLFTSDIASGSNDSFKFVPGADSLLGMTGEYRLIPAELFLFHQRALLTKDSDPNYYEYVFRAREDYLVEKIANSEFLNNFFVYGARHTFIDNVAIWNLKNPDKQVSIIELTPKSLLDVLEKN